jgi:hypothetical protein
MKQCTSKGDLRQFGEATGTSCHLVINLLQNRNNPSAIRLACILLHFLRLIFTKGLCYVAQKTTFQNCRNNGVTIAKEIDLENPDENLGAQMIRDAAEKTGDAVGDGTSTATILAREIFSEGLHNIAAGASAVDLKRGLDRGLRVVVESIRKLSRPVQSRKEKAQVATIAAHNDPAIGELVADAMEKVGKEGIVSVEEAKAHFSKKSQKLPAHF